MHVGHFLLYLLSHSVAHTRWKQCLHGKWSRESPSSKSTWQMGHGLQVGGEGAERAAQHDAS